MCDLTVDEREELGYVFDQIFEELDEAQEEITQDRTITQPESVLKFVGDIADRRTRLQGIKEKLCP